MGQKCCRPATRVDPKHIVLLTEIYNDTQQNVKELNYQSISAYLTKKGSIKTLCDYLSSHLNLINPSLIICRNRQFAMRIKKPPIQMFTCIITTEICQRIIALCKQIKFKYYSKYNNRDEKLEDDEYLQNQMKTSDFRKSTKKQIIKQHIVDLRQTSKSKIGNSRRANTVVNDGYYIEQQISQNVLQICSQVLKQTISSKNILVDSRSQFRAQPNKIQIAQITIIQKNLNILKRILDTQANFVKINDNTVKQILDSQIAILLKCGRQNIQIPAATPSKLKTMASTPLVTMSPVTPLNLLKIEHSNKKSKDQIQQNPGGRISRQSSLFPFQQISKFKLNQQQKLRMGKLSLQNYYELTHKANINLSSANLYRDVVRVHMPKLLQYWADLMMSQKQKQNQHNDNQLSSIPQKQGQQSKQGNSIEGTQRSSIGMNQNIELIQKIILQFFNSYFSYGQSQYVYNQLMAIFDRLHFSKSRISSLQKLIFESLRKYQLRNSVISKWFDYLLDYLGLIMTFNPESNSINQSGQRRNNLSLNVNSTFNKTNQQINYFSQLNSELSFSTTKSDYVNWVRSENIIGCIKTIKRWIQSNQVDIQNILNYKRHKLFVVLLANLARGDFKIDEHIFKLIQYLIVNDVRCYGYLVDTALFFISKLKINKKDFTNQYSWEDYSRKWSTQKQLLLRQSVQQSQYLTVNNNSNNAIKKPSLFSLKLKSIRSFSQVPLQLITVQKFIDELIYIACYPFLSKVLQTLPKNEPTLSMIFTKENQQSKKSRKYSSIIRGQNKDFTGQTKFASDQWSNMKNQNVKGSNKDVKSIGSVKQANQKQHKSTLSGSPLKRTLSFQILQTDIIKQRQEKRNTNKLFSRSVFQQIMTSLFKGISLRNTTINQRYQIKLSSLFIAGNLQTMIAIASKCTRNKDLYYIFNLINKINKFLSKIHKQLKIISIKNQKNENYMLTSRKKSQLQNQNDYQKMFISRYDKQQSIGPQQFRQTIFQQKNKNNQSVFQSFSDFEIVRQILKSLHKWAYPSFIHILMEPQTKISQAILSQNQNQNNQVLDEQTKQYNLKNSKLILNICIKLYIKQLISLVKSSIQKKLKNYPNQNQSDQSVNNQHEFVPRRHSSLIIKSSLLNRIKGKRDSQDIDLIDNQKLKLEQLPVIELFQLYLSLIDKTKLKYKVLQQQVQTKRNSKISQSHTFHLKRRKTISQIKYISNQVNKNSDLIKQKQQNLSQTTQQTQQQIKKIMSQLKNHFNSISQSDVHLENENVLTGSEQLKYRQTLRLNRNQIGYKTLNVTDANVMMIQHNLASEIYDIIVPQNFTQRMFKLVDNATSYPNQTQSLKTLHFNEKSKSQKTQKIIQNYLLKQQKLSNNNILTEQIVDNGRCFTFKKAKNKILQIFNGTTQPPQNIINEPQLYNTPKLVNHFSVSQKAIGPNLQLSQINKDNAHETIPYIISKLQQYYGSSNQVAKSTVTHPKFGIGLDRKTNFSLNQSQNIRRQNGIDSSIMKSSVQSGSFGQIVSQIRKH